MSEPLKQPIEELGNKPVRSHLVLKERPLIVQTGLRDLFGKHEAELIQHVTYCRESPFYDKLIRKEITLAKHEGRVFVHIPIRLMFDPWTGQLRHLSEITYRRTVASCIKQGVMLTKTRLNEEDPNDNTNWFAIVDEVLGPLTGIYEDFWERIHNERQSALIYKHPAPSQKTEEGLRREMWEKIQAKKDELAEFVRNLKGEESESEAPTRKLPFRPQKRVKEAPYQNDRVNLSDEKDEEISARPGIKMIGSTLSKRQGGRRQNDMVEPIKMSGSSFKELKEEKESQQHQPKTEISSAPKSVVDGVESSSIEEAALPPKPQHAAASHQKPPKATAPEQIALPIAATMLPAPDNNRRAWNLAQRLEEHGLPPDEAARVADRLEVEVAPGDKIRALDANEAQLRRALGRVGIHKGGLKGSNALFERHGAEAVRWQVALWPLRPEATDGKSPPAASLINRIENDDPPPPELLDAWHRAHQARTAAARQKEEEERIEREREAAREAEKAKATAQEQEAAALDQMWEKLDDSTRQRLDAQAREKMGITLQWDKTGNGLRLMRHQVLREMLAQLHQEAA